MSFVSSESSECTCYPAERNGYAYNSFIAHVFSQCVYEPRQVIGFWVGMSSLLFWVMAQVPQFIKNKERKSASSLSPWFLLEWMLGDVLNLVGCLLTHQLVTQQATGVLFLIVDSTMISQMTYYTLVYPRKKRRKMAKIAAAAAAAAVGSGADAGQQQGHLGFTERDPLLRNEVGEVTSANDVLNRIAALPDDGDETSGGAARTRGSRMSAAAAVSTLPIVVVMCAGASFMSNTSGSDGFGMSMSESHAVRRMLLGVVGDDSPASVLGLQPSCEVPVHLPESVKAWGLTLGWVSAFIYLNSRLPQMLKNYRRKSVEGLSLVMFFCALMGNSTYGIGVIMHDSSREALWDAAPWLLGSLGTLFLDMFISFQFFLYAEESTTPIHREHEHVHHHVGDTGAYESLDGGEAEDDDEYEAMLDTQSPARGLYGMKSWTTSPLWRPRRASSAASSVRREGAVSSDSMGNLILSGVHEDSIGEHGDDDATGNV